MAARVGDVERKRQFNGLILSSIQLPPSTSPRLYLGSDGIPTEKNAWTGNNYSGYSSAAMDATVSEVESALEPGRRKAGWSSVQKLVADDLPLLPLYFYTAAWVTVKGVDGIDVKTFSPPTNWAERWRRR